jgi:hypothetical protein
LGFHLINLRLAGFWEGAEVLAIAVGHQPHYRRSNRICAVEVDYVTR